jgi:hypothetical protein
MITTALRVWGVNRLSVGLVLRNLGLTPWLYRGCSLCCDSLLLLVSHLVTKQQVNHCLLTTALIEV